MEKFLKTIKNSKKIALFSHESPDPDTIGSTIAMFLALKVLKKDVGMFCETENLSKYHFLPEVKTFNGKISNDFDLLISIDLANENMLGKYKDYFLSHTNTIKLDHHMGGGDYATQNVTKPYSACAILIYEIITKLKVKITSQIATCLYFAICGDTGTFRYSNTDSKTLLVASKLLDFGADSQYVFKEFFEKKQTNHVKLSSKILFEAETNEKFGYAVLCAESSDYKKFNIDPENDNLSNLPNTYLSCGYSIAFILKEKSDGVHCSLRSKADIDVSKLAEQFGGGGHKNASGCKFDCSISKAKKRLCEQIEKILGESYVKWYWDCKRRKTW